MTPDPARRPVTRATHVREHFRTSGSPDGHGYTRRNADQGTAYYAFDHGIVRCVVLGTVNEHGGWQGSLDTGQLSWLVAELAANDWQVRDQISADGGAGAGTEADRNVLLAIDWPRPVPRIG